MSLRAFESLSTVNYLVPGLAGAAASVAILYLWYETSLTSKNGIPLPPGPPARWFWDNALPTVNVARTLADWVAKYGPVIALRQGSQVIVVVGRVDAATEIMEKDGASVADRPRLIAAGELLSQGLRFVFLHNGERLRRYRKAAHTHLQPKATVAHQDVQMESAKNVIMDILNDPRKHQAHMQRFAASVALRVAYGKSTPTSNNDPEVVRIHQGNDNFADATRPGAFLVDRIPLLKYLPGYGRRLIGYHNFEMQLFKDQMDRVALEMESKSSHGGTESQLTSGMLLLQETNHGGESFTRTLLENMDVHQLSRDEMAYLSGDVFGAGFETTMVAIISLIVAAACHPEAQGRVQEELDVVVGKDRVPTWEDSESLPQVHAFVLEVLRWRPVVPAGFAHRATHDIFWRGQWIPAGATVLGCHWAISRDPTAFPEPDKFDPQRWIGGGGRLRNDMTSYPFGFGRRICPGRHLAYKSMYINLALLLWSFHIVQRPDAPIDPNAYTDTIVAHALPFEAEFTPRVEESWLREMMSE